MYVFNTYVVAWLQNILLESSTGAGTILLEMSGVNRMSAVR